MMALSPNGHINRSHRSEEVQAGLGGEHVELQPVMASDVENQRSRDAMGVQNEAGRSQSGTGGAQQQLSSPHHGGSDRSHSLEEVGSAAGGGHVEPQPANVGDVENQMRGVATGTQNGADRSQSGTSGAQLQQAEEKMCLQERGARDRLWIQENPDKVLREAYKMWTEKDDLFVIRAEKKKKQTSSLYNEIYQLVGFYSVFQGVLLTAVAQSNLLTCHNWWTAFFLSCLASVVTICGVIQKFKFIIELEDNMSSEDLSRKDCIRLRNLLVRKRENFSFSKDAREQGSGPKKSNLKLSVVVVVLVLALFSSLFLASIYRILCDPGDLLKKS